MTTGGLQGAALEIPTPKRQQNGVAGSSPGAARDVLIEAIRKTSKKGLEDADFQLPPNHHTMDRPLTSCRITNRVQTESQHHPNIYIARKTFDRRHLDVHEIRGCYLYCNLKLLQRTRSPS
jgi:hypothetical protein